MKIRARDLRAPKYFYQYWPLGAKLVGDYYHPNIDIYRVSTSIYKGQTHYHTERICSFSWQCTRTSDDKSERAPQGSNYTYPYAFHLEVEPPGLSHSHFTIISRVLRACGEYVGFSTTPKEFVRALKKCRIPRWQHEKVYTDDTHYNLVPVPHRYAQRAAEYTQAQQLIAC
jgi:hypothetical protein